MAELRKDALGFLSSLVLAIAGSAPCFSLAASLGVLFMATGTLAPAGVIYCGLIMMGITLAYLHLNAVDPNAGAAFTWGSAQIGLVPGFMAGWALLVASVLFMVSATLPAGIATLQLIAPELAKSQLAATLCAAFWLIAITLVVLRGVALSGWVQLAITAIEILLMAAIATAVAVEGPSLHRIALSPLAFGGSQFANGAVIALYLFWGWDVSLNVSEETKDSKRVPGLGAIGAQCILILLFAGMAAIALLVLTDQEIRESGTSILFAVADKLFPRPWSYLAVLALLLSTMGTLETQLLQFSRTMFAQARQGLFHERWSALHAQWRTPVLPTLLLCGAGILLLLLSLASPSIADIMRQSIQGIGVLASYYYGIAGISCALRFRDDLRRSWSLALLRVIWPALSASALFWAAIATLFNLDAITLAILGGAMALGLIPVYDKTLDTK